MALYKRVYSKKIHTLMIIKKDEIYFMRHIILIKNKVAENIHVDFTVSKIKY